MKNVLLADNDGTVHFLSDTHEGSTHDKPIADATPYPLPEGSALVQDLGFQGFTLNGIEIVQPHKKPRGKQLSDEQKAENATISHRRVRIEHIISSIKQGSQAQTITTLLAIMDIILMIIPDFTA